MGQSVEHRHIVRICRRFNFDRLLNVPSYKEGTLLIGSRSKMVGLAFLYNEHINVAFPINDFISY